MERRGGKKVKNLSAFERNLAKQVSKNNGLEIIEPYELLAINLEHEECICVSCDVELEKTSISDYVCKQCGETSTIYQVLSRSEYDLSNLGDKVSSQSNLDHVLHNHRLPPYVSGNKSDHANIADSMRIQINEMFEKNISSLTSSIKQSFQESHLVEKIVALELKVES